MSFSRLSARARILVLSTWLCLSAVMAHAQATAEADTVRDLNRQVWQAVTALPGKDATRSASPDVQPLLRQRAAALRQLMRVAPDQARAVLFAAAQLAVVRAAAAQPDDVESYEAVQGPADVVIADGEEFRHSVTAYTVHTARGAVQAYQPGAATEAGCGSVLRLEGARLGDTMLVTGAETLAEADPLPVCAPTGPQRVAVLLVHPPGTEAPAETREQVRQALFGPDGRTATNYYAEASFGQTSLTGDVFGWYATDRPYTCADVNGLRDAAMRAADADVDFRQYSRVYVLQPGLGRDCGWSGLGTVGCQRLPAVTSEGSLVMSVGWQNFASGASVAPGGTLVAVFTHELGHNYGLGHARTVRFHDRTVGPDRQQAELEEYGDPFNVMGGATNLGHFAASHKARLGWLRDGDGFQAVQSDGIYRVRPLESAESGLKALRIRRPVSPLSTAPQEWLWLEYRQPVGLFDPAFGAALRGVFSGALLRHEESATVRTSDLVDLSPGTLPPTRDFQDAALAPGVAWHDRHSNLSIEVLSATSDELTVSVQYEPRCATLIGAPTAVPQAAAALSLGVTAGDECSWRAAGNHWWNLLAGMAARRGADGLRFEVGENAAPLPRRGSVTVGRQTHFFTQPGPARAPRVLSVQPSQGRVPTGSETLVEATIQDENGVADLDLLTVSYGAEAPATDGCSFQFDFLGRLLTLRGTPGGFTMLGLGEQRTIDNGRCRIGPISLVQTSATEAIFRATVLFRPALGEAVSTTARLADRSGQETAWGAAAAMSLTTGCVALPRVSQLTLAPTNGTYSVEVSAGGDCAWEASGDAEWLQLRDARGTGRGVLSFSTALNDTGSDRSASIRLGDNTIQVTQLAVVPVRVSLPVAEASFGAQGGTGRLNVTVVPGNAAWAIESDADWLVPGARPETGSGAVSYSVMPNAGERRIGRLRLGGTVLTVFQAGQDQ